MTDDRGPRRSDERDETLERDTVTEELVRYGAITDARPSSGFADRVMAAVEAAPVPARGGLAGLLGAWLARLSGPAQQTLRVAAIAAVVVLAVGGALVGGELTGLLRQGPSQTGSSGSPLPSQTVTASPSVSPSPSLTPSPTLEPTETPQPSSHGTDVPQSSATQSTEGSPRETGSPRPSASEDGGGSSETPQPTETSQPTASSGSGSGDG